MELHTLIVINCW